MNRKECYEKIKEITKTEEGRIFFGNYPTKSTVSLISLIDAWEIRNEIASPTLEEAVSDTIEYLFEEGIINSSEYEIDEVVDEVLNNVFYDEEIDPEREVKEAALASYEYIKGLICGIER